MELYFHSGMQVARWESARRLAIGDRLMELFLQFGYGMMDHSRTLVGDWGGGTVIMSPRDLSPAQLSKLGSEITALPNGRVLIDPQFYLPDADHERLVSHDYWPSAYATGAFWTGTELRELLKKLVALNTSVGASDLILPGLYADKVDDDWIARQQLVIDEAKPVTTLPLLATVALSADALRRDDDVDDVLAGAEHWDVSGVYVVCEHPNGDYLTKDPGWMANLLDLVAGLRLKGKRVIVGYCNHQMLSLAAAGASAIASGTWMNVRSFPPDKFRAQYDEEIKQRAVWYYCPDALSEYKLPFLDIARKQGVLAQLATPASFQSDHATVLFGGAQPTSIKWSEQAAFRHYLQCLSHQVATARANTFDATADAHERALDAAEKLLATVQAAGVRGGNRDFRDSIDVNRAALGVLRSSRGPLLRHKWASL